MTELTWDGKYKDGKKQGPVRIALPFQTIETVNESAQRPPLAAPKGIRFWRKHRCLSAATTAA
jgi:hypothetical protein